MVSHSFFYCDLFKILLQFILGDMLELDNKKSIYVSGEGTFYNEWKELLRYLKLRYRIAKKIYKKLFNIGKTKNFTNIVYLTADCPPYVPNTERLDSPVDYIFEMRKQYPDLDIRLMIPLLGFDENTKITKKFSIDFNNKFFDLEKTSISFEFFLQNKTWEGIVYKFIPDESNVVVYGIFSPAFSYLQSSEEIVEFEKSILFLKAARIAISFLNKENFKPDIIHSETLPFFMGTEFEQKLLPNTCVLQTFDNFLKLENQKQEPFWSLINLADKKCMHKIYKDPYIQDYISKLFNLPIKNITPKMEDCINLVFDNYKIFHKSNSSQQYRGDIIFRHLNTRVKKLFPAFIKKEQSEYYPFLNTLLKSDIWALYSKTYYNDLFSKKLASPLILKEINNNYYKSAYIQPAIGVYEISNKKIYNDFDIMNYRQERVKNKKTLIKEFSSDSIKTGFIDETLFQDYENVKIYGYLDTFYEAPLLFANPDSDIFPEGIDILFGTLLKLFERNKNIQIIISVKDGLKQEYIKSVVNFLYENKIFIGRWVYVNGEVNLPKIFSGSDIYLYPARICDKSVKHLLGYKYGAIPVTSSAGILNDTVIDIFDDIADGNGFKTKSDLLYEDENTNEYINTLVKALDLFNNNPSSWNRLIKNNLMKNIGWDFEKLEEYNKIYRNIL